MTVRATEECKDGCHDRYESVHENHSVGMDPGGLRRRRDIERSGENVRITAESGSTSGIEAREGWEGEIFDWEGSYLKMDEKNRGERI